MQTHNNHNKLTVARVVDDVPQVSKPSVAEIMSKHLDSLRVSENSSDHPDHSIASFQLKSTHPQSNIITNPLVSEYNHSNDQTSTSSRLHTNPRKNFSPLVSSIVSVLLFPFVAMLFYAIYQDGNNPQESSPQARPQPAASAGAARPNQSKNPQCGVCHKNVYKAEEIKAISKSWHKECFKCQRCERQLDLINHCFHSKMPYCNHAICFQEKAKAQGFIAD